MTLRTSFLFALNVSIASGLIISASSWVSVTAFADTLPPVTVTPCTGGNVPIFNGDDYYCGDPSGLLGSGSSVGQGNGGGGGGGSGGGGPSTSIPEKAQGSCHDIEELATPAANVAFKAYWETNLKPRIAPNGKTYTVTFSDGSQQSYVWNNIISSSYAVNPAGPCTG